MDTASSTEWAESALDVSTCPTPTHSVYSVMLQRFLLPIEHLALQGIFREDAENHNAFDSMVGSNGGKLAKDLAGNSFSGTVAQAAFLTSLVTCTAWREIGIKLPVRSSADQCPSYVASGPKRQRLVVVHENSSEGDGEKPAEGDGEKPVDEPPPLKDQPRCSNLAIPTKRIRKKTSLSHVKNAKRVLSATGKSLGNHKAGGKKKMATLAQKEAIMRTYHEAVDRGDPKPLNAIKTMPGYFKSCVCPSKWGKARKEQNWSVFVAAAPHVCEKRHELPDAFRHILKMGSRKDRSGTESNKPEFFHLPTPLQTAIEDALCERLDLGEEVQMPFVKNLPQSMVEVWNSVAF